MTARVKVFTVAILLFTASLVSAHIVRQQSTETQDVLLQFTVAGHVLGFSPDGIYIANGDHMLQIEFSGASGAAPRTNGVADGQPFQQASYGDLWQELNCFTRRPAKLFLRASGILMPERIQSKFSYVITKR